MERRAVDTSALQIRVLVSVGRYARVASVTTQKFKISCVVEMPILCARISLQFPVAGVFT